MKKVSNKVLSRAFGGKMFGSKTECERWEGGCRCRQIYYTFWVKSYGAWNPAADWQCN